MVIKMSWKDNIFGVQSFKNLIGRGFASPKWKEKQNKKVFDIDGKHPLFRERFKYVK
jgi:hypothetical protein